MAVPTPEISGSSIIIVGEFPPSVFHPQWFVDKELLSEADFEMARIDLVSSDVTSFNAAWLTFYVDRQRLQILTSSEPIVRVQDLALGLIAHFAEMPVQFIGLNREVHIKLGSEAAWHRLGDRIAPMDCWPEDFVMGERPARTSKPPVFPPGLRALIMERPRDEPAGHIQMRIEPSVAVRPFGVYFASNDHYDMTTSGRPAAAYQVADLIRTRWVDAMAYADMIRKTILERATQ